MDNCDVPGISPSSFRRYLQQALEVGILIFISKHKKVGAQLLRGRAGIRTPVVWSHRSFSSLPWGGACSRDSAFLRLLGWCARGHKSPNTESSQGPACPVLGVYSKDWKAGESSTSSHSSIPHYSHSGGNPRIPGR